MLKSNRIARSIYMKTFRRKILIAEGLDGFEEAPQQIFDGAIFKYFTEDAEFKQKFQDLERERVSFMNEFGKRKLQYAS